MNILFHKSFRKSLKKQPVRMQKQFSQKLLVFELDPFDPLLSNHALRGEHRGKRSINISGDVRALYVVYEQADDSVIFIDIGGHSELYG